MNETDFEQDPTLITFGSVIAIADFQDQNAYIFSDGFLKTQIILKNFVHKSNSEGLKNNSFFHCLFQVYPKVSDTIKTAQLKRFDLLDAKIQGDLINESAVYETQQTQVYNYMERYKVQNVNEIQNQLMNEYKYNIDTFEKSKGSKLSYNQPFQLLHLASSRFLACHEVESLYENQNYELRLDDFSSDATVFLILPAYKFQKDGEQDINAGEMCTITRAIQISNKTTYVHSSSLEISEIKNQSPSVQHKKKVKQNQVMDGLVIIKREVNASVEEAYSWKIIKFQQYVPENSKYLVVGDCIWLHHSEAESTLVVQRKHGAVNRNKFECPDFNQWISLQNVEVTVMNKDGSTDKESSSSQSGYSGSINGLWQIEGSDFNQGGYVQFEKTYRLKHLTSGFYLQVIQNPKFEKGGPKIAKREHYLFSLTDQTDKSTLFEFVELKTLSKDKYIKPGSYIYMRNVLHKRWVDFYSDNEHGYKVTLKPQNERTEHAVFKVHKASKNEVWEINFLLSSFRVLAKFLIMIQNPQYPGSSRVQEKKIYANKIQRVSQCVANLDDFVNNKAYSTSLDQTYGSRNPERQKLLKEQFYIDLLVLILKRVINKGELEYWQKRHEKQLKEGGFTQENEIFDVEEEEEEELNQLNKDEDEDYQTQNQIKKQKEDMYKEETIHYVGCKINLCNTINKFLTSLCKNNKDNQNYLYYLIPYFQLHTKYLALSTNTIIDIISQNKNLLLKLSEGVKIEITNKESITNEQEMQQIKILINLFEEQSEGRNQPIPFKQNEKITSRPINLINYFINLLWDDEAQNNSDYLKFLRSVCRYKMEPLATNQENIYKLYKKYNDARPKLGVETKAEEVKQLDGTVRLMSKAGQLIIPSECTTTAGRFKLKYIMEQLTFFSAVAFGRNFLWKKELGAQFEKSFLFRNIWNKRPTDDTYLELQPCFAKIAGTLYIDQEPLQEKKIPIYCQVFADCDKAEDLKVFRSTVDNSQNTQELNTYNDLVFNMVKYFNEEIYEQLRNELEFEGGERIDQEIGKDLLKDELISDSTSLLYLLIRLDLFQVLEHSFDKALPSQELYSQFIKIMLYIFQYEKFELKFVKAHVQSFNQVIRNAKEFKKQKNQLIKLPNLGINFSSAKREDDQEDAKGETLIINEQSLYQNQLMRGYIKFIQRLTGYNYMDPIQIHNELQVKLNICDTLERLLDLRQNFMMKNVLVFFKHYIINGEHDQENEVLMKKLQKETKKNEQGFLYYSQLPQEQKDNFTLERLMKIHQKGLLPNIAKTGIKEVDEPKKKNDDSFSAFKKLKNLNFKKEIKIETFKNYIAELNIKGIPEILDLDQYFSIACDDPNPFEQPIASMLPTLLNSFMLIQDKELEKRSLGVIMRIFNQNEEFKQNLLNMQVIFDKEKTLLYKYVQEQMKVLQKHIGRIDVWFSAFDQNPKPESAELDECILIINNIANGMYTGIGMKDNAIIYDSQFIKDDKQVLLANLQAHIPIINFIQEAMPYFHDVILDSEFSRQKKYLLIKLFQACFRMLINFSYQNFFNQLKLFEYINVITSYLQYDLGQIQLLCTIFKDNKYLLINKVDHKNLWLMSGLIEREGRQEMFLNLYEIIMSYEGQFLFDNQLMVTNTLLPTEISDKTIKGLYADGSNNNREIRFYLDDVTYFDKEDIFEKLEEADFKDTFRDEPFLYHAKLLNVLLLTSLNDIERRKFKINFSNNEIQLLFNTKLEYLPGKRTILPEIKEEDYKDNFNISVGKLKTFFRAEYLLELLREKDRFINNVELSLKKSSPMFQSKLSFDAKGENENQKIGFSILKPIVLEFLRLIHVQSERGALQNSQLYESSYSVALLYETEAKRIEIIQDASQFSDIYIDYCMDQLVPFIICYFERFLRKTIESQQTEDDMKDLQMIDKFTKVLLQKIIKLGNTLSPFIDTQDRALLLLKLYYYIPCQQFEQIKENLQSQQTEQSENHELVMIAKKWHRLALGLDEQQYQNFQQKGVYQTDYHVESSSHDEEDDAIYYKKSHKYKSEYYGVDSAEKPIVDQFDDEEEDQGYDKDKAIHVEQLWKKYVNILINNEIFEQQQDQERMKIATAIFNIQKLFNPQFSKNVTNIPDVKTVSKKLINFLKLAFSDTRCKITIETLLKILKKMVEKEQEGEKKVEMQNLFDRLGGTTMVLMVLSENTTNIDKQMLMNFLEFINILLEGGNTTVQATIFDFMINYSQSELIFHKIYMIIRKQIDNITQLSRNKQHQGNRSTNQQNNEDSSMFALDAKEREEDLKLMNLVLKFLQNSVEGHYLNIQNYFRNQTNSRNNYDLIISVADLFKTYYYEAKTEHNYDNIIRCLDTLNELVQGPCPENQIAVSESKFFDIASDLFSKKQKHMKKHNNDQSPKQNESLPKWMVTRLQNKVLMLLLSLLEGREINESNQVLKRIMRNLPLTMLEHHLTKIYKKYRIIYKDNYVIECLQHLQVNPQQLTEKQRKKFHKKYFETVLQNGFLLFFLIQNYMDCDPSIESPIVQLHKQYKKNILERNNDNLAAQLFKESVFGQLYEFIQSLLSSILGVANQFQKLAQAQFQKENDEDKGISQEEKEKAKAEKNRKFLKQAVGFYMKNSAHIDVMHGDKLEIVYFILLPFTSYLPREKKDQFHDSVDRNTTQTKVQGLVNQADNFIEVCQHEETLKLLFDKYKFLAPFTNYIKLWREFSFFLSLFLNIFILLSFDGTQGPEQRVSQYIFMGNKEYSFQTTQQLIQIIGTAMTACSVFVVSFFLLKTVPIIIKRSWREPALFEDQKNSNIIFGLINATMKIIKVFINFFQEIEVLYYTAYGIFSILGTVIHPFFFVFHLSEILFRYPMLKNIILSIWQPRQQLILAIFLLIILVYFFAIIAYTWLSDNFNGYCDTLLYCLTTCINWTIQGSIGVYIDNQTQSSNNAEIFGIGRWFFDTTSNIALAIIMLNIVAGIIIDTFGSLRESEANKLSDKIDKCFICGNLEATFERYQSQNKASFYEHIKMNHYMWNYLFFIAYLKNKDKTEYSGIESYVAERLGEDDLCWIPFNQARELRSSEVNEELSETELIEQLQKRVGKVQDHLKEAAKILKINYTAK